MVSRLMRVLLTVFFAALADTGEAHTSPIDLGTLGGKSSHAVAINASGRVVGHSDTVDGGSMRSRGPLREEWSICNV
jgi:hypothetical protein